MCSNGRVRVGMATMKSLSLNSDFPHLSGNRCKKKSFFHFLQLTAELGAETINQINCDESII